MFVEADYQDSKPNKFDKQTFRGVSILQPDVSEIKPSGRFEIAAMKPKKIIFSATPSITIK
jgi:hypothetical protein